MTRPRCSTASSSSNCKPLGHELERGRDLCVWGGWDAAAGLRRMVGTWAAKSPTGSRHEPRLSATRPQTT